MEYAVRKATVSNCWIKLQRMQNIRIYCRIVIHFIETKQILCFGISSRPAKYINISIILVYLFEFMSFYSLWCQFLHTLITFLLVFVCLQTIRLGKKMENCFAFVLFALDLLLVFRSDKLHSIFAFSFIETLNLTLDSLFTLADAGQITSVQHINVNFYLTKLISLNKRWMKFIKEERNTCHWIYFANVRTYESIVYASQRKCYYSRTKSVVIVIELSVALATYMYRYIDIERLIQFFHFNLCRSFFFFVFYSFISPDDFSPNGIRSLLVYSSIFIGRT